MEKPTLVFYKAIYSNQGTQTLKHCNPGQMGLQPFFRATDGKQHRNLAFTLYNYNQITAT